MPDKYTETWMEMMLAHWNASSTEMPVHKYMGLSYEEYGLWVSHPAEFYWRMKMLGRGG